MTDKKEDAVEKDAKVEKAEAKPAEKKSEAKKDAPKPKKPEAKVEAAEPVAEVAEEPKAETAVKREPSWDVATWNEVCRVRIGVAPYVLAGALSGQDKDALYTEREIRRLVEKFLNTPAK